MFSEIDFQTAAEYRRAELVAEATTHRFARGQNRTADPQPRSTRLQTLLRRLAGAPTFA